MAQPSSQRWGLPRFNFGFKKVPEAEKLFNLCEQTIQKSAERWSEKVGSGEFVINGYQCNLLVNRLSETERILATKIQKSELLDGSKIIEVLQELLETVLDAEALIKEISCVTASDWPRAGIEQGDMKETFANLLYEVKWCTDILLSTLVDNSKMSHCTFGPEDCDGKLSKEHELDRVMAMQADEESLKDYLTSVKLDDPTKQELADQLLQQMEAPSSNLKMLFLNLEGFVRNGKVLGSGSFGAVQSTTYLGSPCAVKVVGVSSPGLKGLFQKELDVIKELGHHPHLVRLFCYSHSEEDQSSYLIMEKMDMDLSKAVLLNKGAKLPMIKAVSLMLQIADGVEFIHSKRVAHRDLKPENVLVNRETSSGRSLPRIRSVKIADFGVSKTKEASKTYSNQTANTGTSWYMAPEVIKIGEDDSDNPRFNPRKADVYSFAIMCAVILNGKGPYDDSGESAKQIKIKVKEGTLRPSLPAHCPARLGILIQKCWAGTPSKRPLFDVICRELRYIKGLLLRGDEKKLDIADFERLELMGVEGAKIDGPWGGKHGRKFIDIATSIRRIKLNYSIGKYALVGPLEVTYELFGISFARKYCDGRNGVHEKVIVFDQCEFITCITVVTGPLVVTIGKKQSTITCVKSLTIHTNITSYGPFGEKNEEKDEEHTTVKGNIIGFHGAAGSCLDSLGVVVIPEQHID